MSELGPNLFIYIIVAIGTEINTGLLSGLSCVCSSKLSIVLNYSGPLPIYIKIKFFSIYQAPPTAELEPLANGQLAQTDEVNKTQ